MTGHRRFIEICGESIAILLLAAGCTPAPDGSSVKPQPVLAGETARPSAITTVAPAPSPTPSSTAASPATGKTMEDSIKQSFSAMAAPAAADSWPEKDPSGNWHSPAGKAISPVFVIRYSRPREQDGWPFTAYVSAAEKLYWVHEGGGISGIDRWYGPFPTP